MTLRELVGIMNMADVSVASLDIPDLYPGQARKIDMFDLEHDPILAQHGSRQVVKLTNVGKQGDMIWI